MINQLGGMIDLNKRQGDQYSAEAKAIEDSMVLFSDKKQLDTLKKMLRLKQDMAKSAYDISDDFSRQRNVLQEALDKGRR